MTTAAETLQGREALEAKIRELQDLGRTVLLVAGIDGQDYRTQLYGPMPTNYASKDYRGRDTTGNRELAGFDSRLVGSAILLALALRPPRVGPNGTGPYCAYRANTPGVIHEDLMSSEPTALEGRESTVHIVDATGWEPADAQVAEDTTLGPPLKYKWLKTEDPVAVLATVGVSFKDIAADVRYEADPSNAYPL